MNKKDLEEHLKFISGFTEKQFKEDGNIGLTFFLLKEEDNGDVGIMPMPVPDVFQEERVQFVRLLGKSMHEKKLKVDAIFATSEAWASRVDAKKNPDAIDKDGIPKVMPRNDPNRTECVFICGMNEMRNTVFRAYNVKETAKGKRTLVLSDLLKDAQHGGKSQEVKPDTLTASLLEEFWSSLLVPFNSI